MAKIDFQTLANSDVLDELKHRSRLTQQVEQMQVRLADPGCDWDETVHTRAWLQGVNAVFQAIEMHAAQEQFPTGESEETMKQRALADFGGWAAVRRARLRQGHVKAADG